ncbi:MAG: aldehyde dehydrogenase [Chloroflexi bacterium]|nr:aldehyde dehydrogenase [Chloroflexota bacterium]
MTKIAIHGFGRIGRSTARVALSRDLFVPAAISDIQDPATLAELFAVDSNYGIWPEPVAFEDGKFLIGDKKIPYFNTAESIPDWGGLGVDVVIDCTGRATTRAGAQVHLDRGARLVLVSANSKSLQDCDALLLASINLDSYDPREHRIVSMASCTTNALAPVIKVIRENFGIRMGFFTTVHAYTASQALTDQPMRHRRDSWAAAENIIPSASGAAQGLKFIWPDLNVTGKAYRVPVRTGSIVEVTVLAEQAVSTDKVKDAFRAAASSPQLKGIMGVLEKEYASSRVVGDSLSSLVDLPLTQVLGDSLISMATWYDNEMGYATRLAEVAATLAGRLTESSLSATP